MVSWVVVQFSEHLTLAIVNGDFYLARQAASAPTASAQVKVLVCSSFIVRPALAFHLYHTDL